MDNFLSGGVAELEKAKTEVVDTVKLYNDAENVEKAALSKIKELESQKKFLADKIETTIKDRRGELEKSYEEQLDAAKKSLRAADRNKRIAKAGAVEGRIRKETHDLNIENAHLNAEINETLKQSKMPGFCNSTFYNALYAPRRISDFFIFALVVVIAFAVIPNIACAFIGEGHLFAKIVTYAAIVVFFLLIYFLVLIWTKSGEKAAVIEQIKPNRDQVRINKKKIKKLAKNIRGDKNEEQYGLSDYDADIERAKTSVNDKTQVKLEALKDFDDNTSKALKAEIEGEYGPGIEKLEAESKALREDAQVKRKLSDDALAALYQSYGAYLGAKNLEPGKIDELISIINSGQADNIMQALDVQKGKAVTVPAQTEDDGKDGGAAQDTQNAADAEAYQNPQNTQAAPDENNRAPFVMRSDLKQGAVSNGPGGQSAEGAPDPNGNQTR